MTYPRWATERSADAADGRGPISAAEPGSTPPPGRRPMRPARRFLLILAAVLVALILAILGADLIDSPGLAVAAGRLPRLLA